MMRDIRFNQQMSEHSISMRGNFSQILSQFEGSVNNIQNQTAKQFMIELLYKKFTQFFANELDVSEGV